jgi:predicted small secreted protein
MMMGTFALGILVGVAIAAISAYRVKKKRAREKASAATLDRPVDPGVE